MNKPLQTELWENIQTFAFDDPASGFPFSKKLQKENNWSSDFTSQAIEEYRKFIFLCCVLPNGASPSETVDQVWHLHLTYTTNYWISFCKNTLHKDIHHYPSKGGNTEQQKHKDWYRHTLEQYKLVFGTEPPESIWPSAPQNNQLVGFEIYDKEIVNRTAILFAVLTIISTLALQVFKTNGPDFLIYYFLLIVAGLAVSWILQEHKLKRINQFIEAQFPEKFTTYQIARFLYGPHCAYQTALIDLLKRDIIDVTGNDYKLTKTPTTDPQAEQNPLLPLLTETIQVGNRFTYRTGFGFLDDDKLQQPEFTRLVRLSKMVDYQKFIIPGIVLAIGFARLVQGMAKEKPVGYLVMEIGIFSLVGLMVAAQYSYTYLVFKKAQNIWMEQNSNGYGSNKLNNFTILGTAAIAGFAEYSVLTNVFLAEAPQQRNYEGGGLSGASSSCSSGGDGGGSDGGGSSCGGGGCGGCGGGD